MELRRADELKRRGRQTAEQARFLASRLDRRALMIRAWRIARDGLARFGGTVHPYFAAALRQSWDKTRARRAVALAMAEDRRAMEGSRYGLTLTGLFVLRNATREEEPRQLELALA
jgi:mannitol-1-phosphate/altronate dehydrogenase